MTEPERTYCAACFDTLGAVRILALVQRATCARCGAHPVLGYVAADKEERCLDESA